MAERESIDGLASILIGVLYEGCVADEREALLYEERTQGFYRSP
jgi:hypothetical protein